MRRDRGRKPRRKVCVFCADHIDQIDYKDVAKLRRFTTERGKILPVVFPVLAQNINAN